MKLGVISGNNGVFLGLETASRWYNLTSALGAWQTLKGETGRPPVTSVESLLSEGWAAPVFLNSVVDALGGSLEAHALDAPPSQFLLPLRPGKIVCIGRNYAAHAKETGATPPEEPIIFSKATTACIADGEPILVRPEDGRVDHEGELGVIIGRNAKDVLPEEAQEYIAGYTLVNDVTARDLQKADIARGWPWFRSKSFDTFCPMGPVVALPDEMPWPVEVDIEVKVNGQTRQKSNTRMFLYNIPALIAFITRYMTLAPGDVIATGTPEGISPIHPGDVVEVAIPQIGALRNPVA